jgi:rod shape-determining protein MreD
MTGRQIAITLALVVVAVIMQTTVFGDGRIQPFGSAPNIVTLVVIATVRYLDPEPGILIGFTAGLLLDLLGGSPLGLWAMSLTVIAFITLRVRRRADEGWPIVAIGIFSLTLLGQVLFAVGGTLFGQRTLNNPSVVQTMMLPSVYNTLLAALVLPGVTKLMGVGPVVRNWAK